MNTGDLIRCGKEIGIVLDTQARPPGFISEPTTVWLNVFWEDGDIEGISPEDVDEVLNESK
jgi:hypothetical protein